MSTPNPGAEPTAARLEDYTRATLNILEDFSAEQAHMLDTQRAMLNMLSDSAAEQALVDQTHRAVVNILDDFDGDRVHQRDTQSAILNMLDDSETEQLHLAEIQTAITNILVDFADERSLQDDLSRAMLNLLDDFDVERENAALASRELETANREMEAFSYSVSHDLRGPLRAMDGFSQALVDDYGDQLDDTAKDFLRRVREGSQRMASLIDGLLTLSRVSRQELQSETVNLSAIADSIAEDLRYSEPERDVTFEIAPDVSADGDPRLFAVALANLLENAWKFTAKHDRAYIAFGAAGDNGTRTFFVRDDGAGFDMTHMDKLFQPFNRLHGQSEFDGTGIGLATVHRIVSRHGGEIRMEGAVEKGATVYFTLAENLEGGPPNDDR